MNTAIQAKPFKKPDTHGSHAPFELKPFPQEGKVRVKESAPFLGIAKSTFWLYVQQRRIKQPTRYGKRVSVWDASYIRDLAENGIPEAKEGAQ